MTPESNRCQVKEIVYGHTVILKLGSALATYGKASYCSKSVRYVKNLTATIKIQPNVNNVYNYMTFMGIQASVTKIHSNLHGVYSPNNM